MSSDYKYDNGDVMEVMEAHGLLPEGPLLEEALGLVSLYANLIQKRLGEFPVSVNRKTALLAILEEGVMQEGLILDGHKVVEACAYD